jgi:hypothetical protein
MGGQRAPGTDMLYGYELVTVPAGVAYFRNLAGRLRRRLLGLREVYVTVAMANWAR